MAVNRVQAQIDAALIGKPALFIVAGFKFPVIIEDVKYVWGNRRYLISPDDTRRTLGQRWVNAVNVEVDKDETARELT